jgi:hypothetical protein
VKDRDSVPKAVYATCVANGAISEKFGGESFLAKLNPLWPEDAPHLAMSEIVGWFQSYPYLPRLRDRVVLDSAIAAALSRLDAEYGYADRYDAASGEYEGLKLGHVPNVAMPSTAVIVRADVAREKPYATQKAFDAMVAPECISQE